MAESKPHSVAAVVIHAEDLPEWTRFLDQVDSEQSRSEAIDPRRGDVTLYRGGVPWVQIRFAFYD